MSKDQDFVSKTARASAVKQEGSLVVAADLPRLVPMGSGAFVLLRNPVTHKDVKYRVDSSEFVNALVDLGPSWYAKVCEEVYAIADTDTSGHWAVAVEATRQTVIV